MKIFIVFGTRPEAIKMAPVVQKLKYKLGHDVKVCVTAQHRNMLDQVLSIFQIVPDYDLNIMRKHQTLSDITALSLKGLEEILQNDKPDRVLVHGDTTTTFTASLAAFYQKIPVGHVEAGLRSYDIYAPWPEEINRRLTSCIADLHFAPTQIAKDNLLREGIKKDKIIVTGNTVVDALIEIKTMLENNKALKYELDEKFSFLNTNKKLILVTGHRRENFGEGFKQICKALLKISERDDVEILYPVHLNPNVQTVVNEYLSHKKNIFLIDPQDYVSFVYLMQRCYLILTDSGGIQEEGPTFKKPVLIMRNITERPEAVNAGISKIVGTTAETIANETIHLLDDKNLVNRMSTIQNPFGDGHASDRIADAILAAKNEIYRV